MKPTITHEDILARAPLLVLMRAILFANEQPWLVPNSPLAELFDSFEALGHVEGGWWTRSDKQLARLRANIARVEKRLASTMNYDQLRHG